MTKDTRMIIAMTGQRPQSLDGDYTYKSEMWRFIDDELERTFQKINPKRVITGMALGVDTVAAEVAFRMGIPFTAAVPFVGQEKNWSSEQQQRYRELLNVASDIEIVCKEPDFYAKDFQKRNEWMVDNADIVVAVSNRNDGKLMKGGTANCIRYAFKQEVPVYHIDPVTKNSGRLIYKDLLYKYANVTVNV